MPRSPYQLAALATAAVPSLDAATVRAADGSADYDIAIVTDRDGVLWEVRAPRTTMAGAAQEAELELLSSLHRLHEIGELPFAVPEVAGLATLPEGGRVAVYRHIAADAVDISALRPGDAATNLGHSIAAIHELPLYVIEASGLPSYPTDAYRERRLVELVEATSTGRVPDLLERRWKSALSDQELWQFAPVPVHGDLAPEHVLFAHGRVAVITGWSEARVADPADDLAWLLATVTPETADVVLAAYLSARPGLTDPRLEERAYLVGELALIRWLMYGVRHALPGIVADAERMLWDLDRSLTEP